MDATSRIKVLVSHENPVLQAGIVATLACNPDFECAEADESTVSPIPSAPPDVIVTSHFPTTQRDRAGSRWAHRQRQSRVLIVTQSDRESDIRAALANGVYGYLLLDCASEYLATAVRSVREGRRFLSPRVASCIAETLTVEPLTRREAEVIELVVEGLCNKVIATRLGLAPGTVKSHLRHAFSKLNVGSRTQAVAMAKRIGLVDTRVAV
jgi:DNA-binding NarL/FixJ family response regulator